MTKDELNCPDYKPENLLDEISNFLKLRNDAQLSRALKVGPPVISKIRHRSYGISHRLLIMIHDATGIGINELRKMAGLTLNNSPAKEEGGNV